MNICVLRFSINVYIRKFLFLMCAMYILCLLYIFQKISSKINDDVYCVTIVTGITGP